MRHVQLPRRKMQDAAANAHSADEAETRVESETESQRDVSSNNFLFI